MTQREAQLVREALRTARREIEAMEEEFEDYVATGRLFDQLDDALSILDGYLSKGHK